MSWFFHGQIKGLKLKYVSFGLNCISDKYLLSVFVLYWKVWRLCCMHRDGSFHHLDAGPYISTDCCIMDVFVCNHLLNWVFFSECPWTIVCSKQQAIWQLYISVYKDNSVRQRRRYRRVFCLRIFHYILCFAHEMICRKCHVIEGSVLFIRKKIFY